MKKILLVILLGITVFICLISGIAAPVMALTYHDIYKDFRDYEVASFDNIPIVLNSDTFNLNVYGNSYFNFNYKMDSCPSGIIDKNILLVTQVYDNTNTIIFSDNRPIIVPCSTTYLTKTYDFPFYYLTPSQSQILKNIITKPDNTYLYIRQRIYDTYNSAAYSGITINFRNLEM